MIKMVDKAIYLPKGDTAKLDVFDSEFLGLTVSETDKLLFLVTTNPQGTEIFRKVIGPADGVFSLTFTQEESEAFEMGSYLWQVRQYTNGVVDEEGNLTGTEINTPFGPQVFRVTEVLGNGTVYA